ncbi:MAG: tripartite tricarboxylate transporter TctB family protein [bacterium]
MRRAETIMAAVLTLGGALFLREALRRPITWTAVGPGAGFFPFWLALGVTACAAILVMQSLRAPAAAGGGQPFIPAGAWKPLLVVFLPMVAVVVLIDYLGIYLGGALYLAGYTSFVGRQRWYITLLVTVLIPAALFFIFERWFLLLLPKGTILTAFLDAINFYGR